MNYFPPASYADIDLSWAALDSIRSPRWTWIIAHTHTTCAILSTEITEMYMCLTQILTKDLQG